MKLIKKSLIALFLLLGTYSEARYLQTSKVKYMTNNNLWSDIYTVDVTFMSGLELNTATKSYKYSFYDVYAIIFWGDGQATVIKTETMYYYKKEVDISIIKKASYYGEIVGKDQYSTKWKICVTDTNCN